MNMYIKREKKPVKSFTDVEMDIKKFNKPVKSFTEKDIKKLEVEIKVAIEDYEKTKGRGSVATEIAIKELLRNNITPEDYQENRKLLDLRKEILAYAASYSLSLQKNKKGFGEHNRGSSFWSFHNDDAGSKS